MKRLVLIVVWVCISQILRAGNTDSLPANARNHAWKFSVFSPLFMHTTFALESEIKPGRVLESSITLNGVGATGFYPFGFGYSAGLKMKPKSRPYGKGGGFLKPALGINCLPYAERVGGTFDPVGDTLIGSVQREGRNIFITAMAIAGSEWHLSRRFMVEVFGGGGYELALARYRQEGEKFWSRDVSGGYRFTHISFGKRFPVAITAGINLCYKF